MHSADMNSVVLFCINTTIPRSMTIHRTCELVSIYKSAKSALDKMVIPRKLISSSWVLRKLNMMYRLVPGLSLHTRAACCWQGLFYITTLLSVATIHSVGGGWHYYGAMVWWYGLVNRSIWKKYIYSSATLPTTNPTPTDLGSNPGTQCRRKVIF